MAHPRRILIVRLSAIGDCLHCTPVAQALRLSFPDAEIGWAVHTHCASVVLGNPFIDRVHEWPRRDRWRALLRLRQELRATPYDVSIDMQGLLKSGLVGWVSGAPERWGPADAREKAPLLYNRWMPAVADLPVVQANLVRAAAAGARWSAPLAMHMPFSDEDRASAAAKLAEEDVPSMVPIVAINPATSRPIKDWKPARYGKLARRLTEAGASVVLTGGPADVAIAAAVVAAAGDTQIANLVGKTSLRELAAVLERADLFVGGDTGPLHIARAVQTPVLALFGPSNAEILGPTEDEGRAISKHWPCSPCRHKACPIGDACLNAITVDEVLAAALDMLNREPIEPKTGPSG